jgi:hypothetical protein
MGEEIRAVHFSHHDFRKHRALLRAETEELEKWFLEDRFDEERYAAGFELEAWLNDSSLSPAPLIDTFLKRLKDPHVVPELAQFNVEVNAPARPLGGGALGALRDDLSRIWRHCTETADSIGARMLMIGTHPTVEHTSLTLENMTAHHRYRALNEQVMRLRRGRSLVLDIRGREDLLLAHRDLTFEAAATSFQIHLQVPRKLAVRLYNASIIAAAPLVAAAANSPFLFGKDLWDETRIPLFEQSVAVDPRRVTLGSGYLRESVMECFRENLTSYPVLLPEIMEEPLENLHHLRLHNGTVWRWVRPLIGFDDDGRPHLRIEQRVVPAGPSIIDSVSNAAFYYGMAVGLIGEGEPPEDLISFGEAGSNFYAAAREGLGAVIRWPGREARRADGLIMEELLPLAREGLDRVGVDRSDAELYLGVIAERVATGMNGAAWQREYVRKHRCGLAEMTAAYHRLQQLDKPVHSWDV